VAVLSRTLGADHVVGGVAHIASTIAAPGVIRHTGTMARLQIGELDGGHSERVATLSDALEQAGVEHEVSADIEREIWAKMVFLATFSGLTGLTRLPIGPVRADPETRALYHAGLAEALAVARAKGIALPEDFAERALARTDKLPAAMKSSLLHDLENGRRLELPWLSGAIVRMGRELGVATPTHAFVTTALKLHADGDAARCAAPERGAALSGGRG
jgi:2-dehydropantoate 2-reductase